MSTIADVAKEAGVSVATVSRVINGNVTVSPSTAQKVKLAVEKFNYKPNIWGRSLRRRESRMLLILVPNITNPYYAPIVSGIEDTARRNQYNTMLCITNMDQTREREYMELLRTGRADGAILLAIDKQDKQMSRLAKSFPIVQCCEYCADEELLHVSIDNFLAAKQVTEYLLRLGHTRIGFAGSTNSYISSELRQKGYEAALQEANIKVEQRYIAYADMDYSFASGCRAVQELLCLQDRPTAVFCISDVIGLGSIQAAQELGLRVPEDLTIVGFDDVQYASIFRPMLTTVAQPGYSMGKLSADMLLGQMRGDPAKESMFLAHKLILRDSSAPLGVLE